MEKYNGLIISFIAGISTILGYFFIYLKGDRNKIISSSLAFAGGVMITLSFIDLIPSSVKYLRTTYTLHTSFIYSFLFIIIGFILSYLIQILTNEKEGLYKTGIISMIGIMLHNIPEGIATYIVSSIDIKLGFLFSIAIIMHNIPEGIGISIPIYYSTKSKKKAFLYTLLSGFSEPLGAFISMLFFHNLLNQIFIGYIYSIIAGLMIYIGYFELIKTSRNYSNSVKYFTLIGSILILIVEIILKM